MGEIAKKVQQMESYGNCDEKRGALRGKEGNGNESTRKMEELREDGWT